MLLNTNLYRKFIVNMYFKRSAINKRLKHTLINTRVHWATSLLFDWLPVIQVELLFNSFYFYFIIFFDSSQNKYETINCKL
jgi:hypothetical protein